MFDSCLEKQKNIKDIFFQCPSKEAKYQKIIELGKELPPFQSVDKTSDNLVQGCQSTMYLLSSWVDGKIVFAANSDALISAGLAALLIKVYSHEPPETILKCTPVYLEELGISASLTPNRANGLYSIHLKMKQDAIKFLMRK